MTNAPDSRRFHSHMLGRSAMPREAWLTVPDYRLSKTFLEARPAMAGFTASARQAFSSGLSPEWLSTGPIVALRLRHRGRDGRGRFAAKRNRPALRHAVREASR